MLKVVDEAYLALFELIKDNECYSEVCIAQCAGCICSCRCSCSGNNHERDLEWEDLL